MARKHIFFSIIICIFLVLIFLSFPKLSYCFFYSKVVEENTPFVYKITLNNLNVSSDNAETWKCVQKEPIVLDIVKKDAIDAIAYKIPPGDYNKIKYTPNATFLIKGYVKYKGLVYYTSIDSKNGTAVTQDFNLGNPPLDYGEAELTIFGYNEWEYLASRTEDIDFLVEKSKIKEIYITVDLTDSLALYQTRADPDTYQLMPVQPEITIFLE